MNMRFSRSAALALLCLLTLSTPAIRLDAAGQPVTIKELCLMLRSGYTGDEVQRETNGRPLLEPLDDANEKLLRAAGADTRLVDALRATHPALSADEAAAARQHAAVAAQRDALTRQIEFARLQGTAAPAAPGTAAAAANNKNRPSRPSDPRYMANLLRDKLVALHNGSLQPISGSEVDGKKLFGLYFDSYMGRKGHEFTTDLVKLYQRLQAAHPEFEIVLVSGDKSPFEMENLMRRDDMPWPALAFDRINELPTIQRFIDHTGAARLMITDGTGWVMADYYLGVENNNVPMYIPDLEKVVANPTVVSAIAAPHTAAAREAGGSIQ